MIFAKRATLTVKRSQSVTHEAFVEAYINAFDRAKESWRHIQSFLIVLKASRSTHMIAH